MCPRRGRSCGEAPSRGATGATRGEAGGTTRGDPVRRRRRCGVRVAAAKRWRPRVEPRSRTCQPLLPCRRSRCQALYADILDALGLLYNCFCQHVAFVVGGLPCLAGLPVTNRLPSKRQLCCSPHVPACPSSQSTRPSCQHEPCAAPSTPACGPTLVYVAPLPLWAGSPPARRDWMRARRFMTPPNAGSHTARALFLKRRAAMENPGARSDRLCAPAAPSPPPQRG